MKKTRGEKSRDTVPLKTATLRLLIVCDSRNVYNTFPSRPSLYFAIISSLHTSCQYLFYIFHSPIIGIYKNQSLWYTVEILKPYLDVSVKFFRQLGGIRREFEISYWACS